QCCQVVGVAVGLRGAISSVHDWLACLASEIATGKLAIQPQSAPVRDPQPEPEPPLPVANRVNAMREQIERLGQRLADESTASQALLSKKGRECAELELQ